MKPIEVLIVDDEPPARGKLRRFLQEDARFRILGEAEDGEEALEAIASLNPDLVFLDIHMPRLSGLEMVRAMEGESLPHIIFTTAYDQYAVKAFDLHAVDYLLKPFDRDRFREALDRAAARLASGENGWHEKLDTLFRQLKPDDRYLERILVRDKRHIELVPVREIFRFSAEDKYVRIHLPGKTHLIRDTLGNLAKRLDPARFVRIHRGEIVNLDAVKALEPWSHGDYLAILHDGSKVNLSRNYRETFFERLEKRPG